MRLNTEWLSGPRRVRLRRNGTKQRLVTGQGYVSFARFAQKYGVIGLLFGASLRGSLVISLP